jgi:hypothetical protein
MTFTSLKITFFKYLIFKISILAFHLKNIILIVVFKETYCLHLQGREAMYYSKMLETTYQTAVSTPEVKTYIFTAMKA